MAIIPIWQPVGYSTHQIAVKTAQLSNTKGTHTGTLDPMAEGVIIVLTSEDRLKKIELAGWKKKYEFEILFGIKTDSFDALGYIQQENSDLPDFNLLKTEILKFKGSYEQEVPVYSAIKLNGKKLFEYAKNGETPEKLPVKKGEVYSIELLKYRKVAAVTAVQSLLFKLESIRGDFRQEGIIKQWKDYLSKIDKSKEFDIAKISVEISRGMYIRALSQDITKKIGQIGFVYSLVRTQNGTYTKKDCQTMEDIFGVNYDMLFKLE